MRRLTLVLRPPGWKNAENDVWSRQQPSAWEEGMLDDYTPHQQKIIKRYYANQEAISFQRLAELVSDLYLSEGKKRQRVWKTVASALQKLGLPQARIDQLVKQDNPSLVADVVKELEKKGK